MTRDVCIECGDTKKLTPEGVCEWRHGCEHRQMVHEATIERLLAEMESQDWHHRVREHNESLFQDSVRRHPGFRAISGGAEETNRWLDRYLKGDEDAE